MKNKELTKLEYIADKDSGIEYDEEDIIIWGIFNGYLEECVEYYLYMINNKVNSVRNEYECRFCLNNRGHKEGLLWRSNQKLEGRPVDGYGNLRGRRF